MRRRRRAFSLTELLVVMSIVALSAAIVTPVFVAAKEAGKKSVCVENLHSMFLATTLYRQDYESVTYGPAEDMGLPAGNAQFMSDLFRTYKCPDSRPDRIIGSSYFTMFVNSQVDGRIEPWTVWSERQQDQTVMYVDAFHNDIDTPLTDDDYITLFALGIDVGGTLHRVRKMGDWMQFSWWSP